jgi:hypothetical protein
MRIVPTNMASLIRNKRLDLRMSQITLTGLLGWKKNNSQYVSNIELAKCPFPSKSISRLSSALYISRAEIIDAMTKDYNESLNKSLNIE